MTVLGVKEKDLVAIALDRKTDLVVNKRNKDINVIIVFNIV